MSSRNESGKRGPSTVTYDAKHCTQVKLFLLTLRLFLPKGDPKLRQELAHVDEHSLEDTFRKFDQNGWKPLAHVHPR